MAVEPDNANKNQNTDQPKDGDNNKPTFSAEYVGELKAQNEKAEQKVKDLSAKLTDLTDKLNDFQKKFSGVDIDEYQRLRTEREDVEKKRKEAEEEALRKKGEYDKILENKEKEFSEKLTAMEKELVTQIGEKDSRIAALEADLATLKDQYIRKLRDLDIADAAGAEKCRNIGLLTLALEREIKIETEDGVPVFKFYDGTQPRLNSKGKLMTIAERVAEMKQDPNFAMLFDGATSGASSGTKPGASGDTSVKNPWLKGQVNLTMQGKLVRENPDLAARFQAEAKAAK